MRKIPSLELLIASFPIIAGVVILSFTQGPNIKLALIFALLSNVSFTFRNVGTKKTLTEKIERSEKLDDGMFNFCSGHIFS